LVALDSTWSARAHPNRPIMRTTSFVSTDKLASYNVGDPIERSLRGSNFDIVEPFRRSEPDLLIRWTLASM
jgi:hypothetical protein